MSKLIVLIITVAALAFTGAASAADPVTNAFVKGFAKGWTATMTMKQAQFNVRAAVPSIEAYYIDHGSYLGVTDKLLRSYDNRLNAHVVWAEREHYCMESVLVPRSGPVAGRTFAAHVIRSGETKILSGRC